MKLQEFSDELRKDPYFVIAELQLKLEEAAARIEELEAQTLWIPVEDGLPESGTYLTFFDDWVAEDYLYPDGHWLSGNDVTHWMPLPPNPEATNE